MGLECGVNIGGSGTKPCSRDTRWMLKSWRVHRISSQCSYRNDPSTACGAQAATALHCCFCVTENNALDGRSQKCLNISKTVLISVDVD